MAQFKAFDPDVEVLGGVVLSVVNVMGAFRSLALGILEDHGIVDPQEHRWYSQQAWLSSFETIANEIGPNTLYQIGRQIPEQATYPPFVDSLETAFTELDTAYRAAHRGGEVGHYHYLSTGMTSGKLICDTPYPCDFDRGLIESLALRFEPPRALVEVRHEEPAPCKKMGANSCTYLISW